MALGAQYVAADEFMMLPPPLKIELPSYPEKLHPLLTMGLPTFNTLDYSAWPAYIERFSLTDDDIPELLRMATDAALDTLDECYPQTFGPIHARRALGQLKALDAVEPLFAYLKVDYERHGFDEWLYEELTPVFFLMGPPIIPLMCSKLIDITETEIVRDKALNVLEHCYGHLPEHAEACLAPIIEVLGNPHPEFKQLQAGVICFLARHRITTYLPQMEALFTQEMVDTDFCGEWVEVLNQMELLDDPAALEAAKTSRQERFNALYNQLNPIVNKDEEEFILFTLRESTNDTAPGERFGETHKTQ